MSMFDLEDCQLSCLLLFLSLVMKAKNCFVHNSCQHRHLFNLLLFRHSPQFILQGNGDFGFEEAFLLLATHITRVPKLTKYVNFWNFDFGMGFEPLTLA